MKVMQQYLVQYRMVNDVGVVIIVEDEIVADGFAISESGHILFHLDGKLVEVIGGMVFVSMSVQEVVADVEDEEMELGLVEEEVPGCSPSETEN